MQGAAGQAPEWVSDAYRQQKYALHGSRLRVRSVADYDASARDVIAHGARFTYTLGDPPEARVGYYDAWRSRLTVLDEDKVTIINHMHAPESYVRGLPDSDYQW